MIVVNDEDYGKFQAQSTTVDYVGYVVEDQRLKKLQMHWQKSRLKNPNYLHFIQNIG